MRCYFPTWRFNRFCQRSLNAAHSGRVQMSRWAGPCQTGVEAQWCGIGASPVRDEQNRFLFGQATLYFYFMCQLKHNSAVSVYLFTFTSLFRCSSRSCRGLFFGPRYEVKAVYNLLNATTFNSCQWTEVDYLSFLSVMYEIWRGDTCHTCLQVFFGLLPAVSSGLPFST